MNRIPELGATGKHLAALSLTVVGGFVDAVGYIALFEVFTANMSGNSVHLGIYLAGIDLANLARPACAVVAYVLGLVATRIVLQVAARTEFRRIASLTFLVEAFLLLFFARATPAMHLGQFVDLQSPAYFSLVATLAFAMGIQTATLTHIGPLTVYTTFVTGTLTKFSESFTRALFWTWDQFQTTPARASDIAKRATMQEDFRDALFLAAVWSCYVVGAAIGTFAKYRWQLRALYLPVAVLLTFIVLDWFRPIGVQEERHQQGSSAV